MFKVVRWMFLRLPAVGGIEASHASASASPSPPPPPSPLQASPALDSGALLSPGSVSHSLRKEARQQEEGGRQHQHQHEQHQAAEPTRLATAVGSHEGSQSRTVVPTKADGSETVSRSPEHTGAGGGWGLPCVVKVFGFLCLQLVRKGGGGGAGSSRAGGGGGGGAGGSGVTPRRILCLRLMRTALAAAGSSLALYPSLLEMVRDDLCFALLHLMQERCAECCCSLSECLL